MSILKTFQIGFLLLISHFGFYFLCLRSYRSRRQRTQILILEIPCNPVVIKYCYTPSIFPLLLVQTSFKIILIHFYISLKKKKNCCKSFQKRTNSIHVTIMTLTFTLHSHGNRSFSLAKKYASNAS